MNVHHIGYLVKNIERAALDFKNLGYDVEPESAACVIDETRKVKILFLKKDAYRIELVEPLDKESPIYGLLKKHKNSPYHICYSTEDMNKSIAFLEQNGWMLFEEPKKAPAIHDRKVAFLMSADSGMLELVEEAGTGNDNG